MRPRFFKTADELRAWFEAHHARARELQIGFYKKGASRTGTSYGDALDQALCFGWIDGVRHRIDDERYTIRFTPRRPGSMWSEVNTKRARELKADGVMTAAGLAAFEGRDAARAKQYSYESQALALDPAYLKKLRSNRKAWAFFESRTPRYRELAGWWVMSAKKEETRLRRLRELIECSEMEENPKPFRVSRASRRK